MTKYKLGLKIWDKLPNTNRIIKSLNYNAFQEKLDWLVQGMDILFLPTYALYQRKEDLYVKYTINTTMEQIIIMIHNVLSTETLQLIIRAQHYSNIAQDNVK